MSEIQLSRRYPLSRVEDITDAYMRGVEEGRAMERKECHIRNGECDMCGTIIHRNACMYLVPVGDCIKMVKSRPARYCPSCGRKIHEREIQ